MILKSESIKNIALAIRGFHTEVQKIPKTETNPFFKSKYADLPTILEAIRQPLINNGLSFVQFPTGENELETLLMHDTGEFIHAAYKMIPAKNDPQGLGSAITYQRRYALSAILGLSTDNDDDGNAASNQGTTRSQNAPRPDAKPHNGVATSVGSTEDKIANSKSVDELQMLWEANPDLHKNAETVALFAVRKKELIHK